MSDLSDLMSMQVEALAEATARPLAVIGVVQAVNLNYKEQS